MLLQFSVTDFAGCPWPWVEPTSFFPGVVTVLLGCFQVLVVVVMMLSAEEKKEQHC